MVLGHSAGGIGSHVDSLVAGLRADGQEVQVVTAASTAETLGWADAHRLWPLHGGRPALRGPLDWHRIMLLARTVDVVHAHGHQAADRGSGGRGASPSAPPPRRLPAQRPAGGRFVRRRSGTRARPTGAGVGVGWPLRGALRWALRRADLVTGASGDLVALAASMGARRTELAQVPSAAVAGLLRAPEPPAPVERARLLSTAPASRPTSPPASRSCSPCRASRPRRTSRRSSRPLDSPGRPPPARSSSATATNRLRARLEEASDGIRAGDGGRESARQGADLRFVGARHDVPDGCGRPTSLS